MLVLRQKSLNGSVAETDLRVADRPLWVNACGEDCVLIDTVFHFKRPQPRSDYLMIYIKEGYGDFLLNGKRERVGKNNIVLLKPGNLQDYIYPANLKTNTFWIHFSGGKVEEYLTKYRINRQIIHLPKELPRFEATVQRLLIEIKDEFFDDVCAALLQILFTDISKAIYHHKQTNCHALYKPHYMDFIYDFICQTYAQNNHIKVYADQCGLSELYFIRKFKQNFGITPQQLVLNCQINRAIQLLLETTLSVQSISSAVGFCNPYYFSRAFKRRTTMSPTEYRKKYNEIPNK